VSDTADEASEREQLLRDAALKAHQIRSCSPLRESAIHCASCGDEIEEGRRKAVPGTQVCVWCASQITRG